MLERLLNSCFECYIVLYCIRIRIRIRIITSKGRGHCEICLFVCLFVCLFFHSLISLIRSFIHFILDLRVRRVSFFSVCRKLIVLVVLHQILHCEIKQDMIRLARERGKK